MRILSTSNHTLQRTISRREIHSPKTYQTTGHISTYFSRASTGTQSPVRFTEGLDTLQPFNPPKTLLMGPGPSMLRRNVMEAIGHNMIGHMDPRFNKGLMDQVAVALRYAFQTDNHMTLAISGPGSAGMECCFANLVEPEMKVIVCVNGVFGKRMAENVQNFRGIPVVVDFPWGQPVDPNKLRETLQNNRDADIVAFVHAETSTGVVSDARLLAEIAREFHCLTIVDTVTSLGGIPLHVKDWGLDAVYSGSQKCLSAPPGLSPVTFNERVLTKIKARSDIPSWFLNLNKLMDYWRTGEGARVYHHTAPVSMLYALHQALLNLSMEGLENSWARHRANHRLLKAGLEAMGLSFFVEESYRLPQLNTINIPEGVDGEKEKAIRNKLLFDYNIEIGSGLGVLAGKVWRLGLMGETSREENLVTFFRYFAKVLKALNVVLPYNSPNEAMQAEKRRIVSERSQKT